MPPAYLRGPALPPAGEYRMGCTGKVAHAERAEAVRHAEGINAPHVYLCRHCGAWHVSRRGVPEGIKRRRAEGRE